MCALALTLVAQYSAERDELFRNVKYEDECARIRFAVPMQKAWCPIDILNVRPVVP